MKARLRLRMSAHDAHYGGGLVDGARILGLFGDVATELLIRSDGDEGLFRAYDDIEFLAPVHAGDYLEVEGEIVSWGGSSRKMRFCARKVIAPRPDVSESACDVLPEAIVVARASGTCVVPRERQRMDSPGRRPVILTAAITGAETTREQTPHLPLLPEEVAAEARKCRDAGAAVVHLHAREPDGTPTQSRERFKEFIDAIRAATDVIVQTSTGGALGMSIEERCQPLELAPEMASLNIASMNFGDDVFLNPRPEVARIAAWMREKGIVPEIEIYDLGHLDAAEHLLHKQVLAPPLHFQFVLGVPGGLGARESSLDLLVGELERRFPDDSTWAVAAVGRHQLPMADLAIRRGGYARVGLEDNIYVEKGVLAKGSWELAERAAGFATAAGRPLATPDQARELLGLRRR